MKKLFIFASMALAIGFASCSDDDNNGNVEQPKNYDYLNDSTATAKVDADGFFVSNEDWRGNGSVNFFKKSGDKYDANNVTYRAYRAANPGEEFGVTTEFGTIWGDNAYFMSKQGNRLVVADAKTLKKKAVFTTLATGGDGRAFVGVNDTKGYVGTSNGIEAFDIAQLKEGAAIADVSGEIGAMGLSGGKVFAVSSSNLFIIDTATDKVVKTVEGSYKTLTVGKDGTVWVATDKLLGYDPTTLEVKKEVTYPEGGSVFDSWYAWNAGGLCASTQHNVLYWTSGKSSWSPNTIVKYDVDADKASVITTLGVSDHDNKTSLAFYGAGLRVDPLTDELIATTISGYSYFINYIYIFDNNGVEKSHFEYFGDNGTAAGGNQGAANGQYYWFPSVPFFQDANKPQILLNGFKLKPGETQTVDLNEKIVDYDNTAASILKSVKNESSLVEATLDGSKLTVKASSTEGEGEFSLSVVSNGVRKDKKIQVVVVAE